MKNLAKNLNPQQVEAVYDKSGPLLVIAGPGSGKTTILTRRIARLLVDSRDERFKILALTFTTKAANEMKERVESIVGDEVNRLFISTFHGFCFDVLRKYGSYLGLDKEFTIYDQSSTNDYLEILIEAVQEEISKEDVSTYPLLEVYTDQQYLRKEASKYVHAISRLKNQLKGPEDIPVNSRKYDNKFRLIYKLYNKKLRENTAIDYGDLLFLTYQLFKKKPFIAKQYRRVYKHLLIDEAQDTNKAQFEIVKLFCGDKYENLFIVADEDQLIYEWNDAKFEYLLEYANIYNSKIIQMFENYRCPQPVLNMANQLIRLNVNRLDTKQDLKANKNGKEEAVFLNKYSYPEIESSKVSNQIFEIDDFDNTCIIARNRFVLSQVEKSLKEKGIPFSYPSTSERFSSKEAKILVAFLQSIFNEDDRIHISYICNYFNINIGDLFVLKDNTLLNEFLEVIQNDNPELYKIIKKIIERKAYFLEYIESLFVQLTQINFESEPENEEDKVVYEDALQMRLIIRKYTNERTEEERSLGDFLSFLALSPKGNQNPNGVMLLTGHAAKGLEFDYVFIISVNQGIFPDFRSIRNQRALEEERRNFFVAMTRTKKKLYLSYTESKKTRFGYRSHEPSQFLSEIGFDLNT